MKYHIITYGCQMNKSDSERIATVLESRDYQQASKINEADLIVVNMCSVRQTAVDRVYGLAPKFKKLKTENPNLKTILTGCILKQDKKKFARNFDLVLGIKTLPNWPKYLSQLLNGRHKVVMGCKDYLEIQPKYSNDFSAFVSISTGCNNFCAYCVVPFTRGSLLCRPHKEILKETQDIVQKGFKEIWLLGQNVNDYRSPADASVNFPRLLKMVNDILGNFWVSFTSSHPKNFSDGLIKTIADCEKVDKYISLPIQTGDDEILKKMNRPYKVAQYKKLVQKIRRAMPNVCLSTDIIVGFPGETKKQFENTVKLFKEVKFDMAYIAEYSPRPGTLAFKMKDDVPAEEKQKRREVLTKILEKTSLENSQKYIGETVDVLIHEITKKGALIGKTRFYKTVKIKYDKKQACHTGEIAKARIIDVMPWGLKGTLIRTKKGVS